MVQSIDRTVLADVITSVLLRGQFDDLISEHRRMKIYIPDPSITLDLSLLKPIQSGEVHMAKSGRRWVYLVSGRLVHRQRVLGLIRAGLAQADASKPFLRPISLTPEGIEFLTHTLPK